MTSGRRHLVLVGLMGSGKSAVGEAVARRLGRPFLDTDALVEESAGRSVADIFADDGEAAFRHLEAEAVHRACAIEDAAVIACGGGAVLSAGNRRALAEHGFVVLLTAPPEVLAARVGAGDDRPLLAGGQPVEVLERLSAERDALYREAADAVVDTAGRTVEAVADEVADRLGRLVQPPGGRP